MGAFKSWFVALGSRVDCVMSQIENQEGMVNAAIRKTRDAVGKASVQLNRVHQDGVRLQNQSEAARSAVESWRERARACMEQDEQRAMECLRRSKKAEREAIELERRLRGHRSIEKKLREDVGTIQTRLAELIEKRNLMRTRQTRAEAQQVTQNQADVSMSDIEEIFDRWEAKVSTAECLGGFILNDDNFDEEFLREEERATLHAELAALKDAIPREDEKGEQP